MNFRELNVKTEIVTLLKKEGIYESTAIQEKTIPLVHQDKDVIGISRTGSGKTVAFGVPLLERVESGKGVQGIILAPTRELANQIAGELKKWSKPLNLHIATIFGGVSLDPQVRSIAKAEIVVGTPGRILDHLNRRNLNVTKVKTFVLDEADKMVEMGFIEDIEELLSTMPNNRQILLFGATISDEVDNIKRKYMHDVVVAEAELQVKKDLLKQYYYNVKYFEKFSLLVNILKKEKEGKVIIFCSKRSTVELVYRNLRNNNIKADMIHGKMSQNKRLNVIEGFNKGQKNYLVASAVAARGLDIQDVQLVINYDLANDPQEYIHRVGRTARAGESGKAITLLSDQEHGAFGAIFDRYDIQAEELKMEKFPKLRFETQVRRQPRQGGFSNRSPRRHSFQGNYGNRPRRNYSSRSSHGESRRHLGL